jgi:hypothetical protein
MNSEIIIQLQDQNGHFMCESYINVPCPQSGYIAICFVNTPNAEVNAKILKNELINRILNLGSFVKTNHPPCGGNSVGFLGCKALSVPNNFKLLIIVGDLQSNIVYPNITNWSNDVLPVYENSNYLVLPHPFNTPQAAFWNNNITEVIPTIFGFIGVSEDEFKIFISYRRTETSELAEQLYDRLNHEGFDVFLDRFSINPIINFQNRLYQELADKAMILCIESDNYLNSQWVQLEIAFAKKYRLGIMAINLENSNNIFAPKTLSIDDENRFNVNRVDFINNNTVNDTKLNEIVNEICIKHSEALYIKKMYLQSSIYIALHLNGYQPIVDNNGFIEFQKNGKTHKIWSTVRPPNLNDYYHSDNNSIPSNPPHINIVVGSGLIEDKRKDINDWLCNKSSIEFINEFDILSI